MLLTIPSGSQMEEQQHLLSDRHLTSEQREEISADLEGSATGPVSMAAPASDKEAVGYEGEIASVLKDMGCAVEIDNAKSKASAREIPAGVELTIKEETVRPIHASSIVLAFRRAGLVLATRINAMRKQNDTLYITVGANDGAALVPPTIRTSAWRWKSVATHLAEWKKKILAAVRSQ